MFEITNIVFILSITRISTTRGQRQIKINESLFSEKDFIFLE